MQNEYFRAKDIEKCVPHSQEITVAPLKEAQEAEPKEEQVIKAELFQVIHTRGIRMEVSRTEARPLEKQGSGRQGLESRRVFCNSAIPQDLQVG